MVSDKTIHRASVRTHTTLTKSIREKFYFHYLPKLYKLALKVLNGLLFNLLNDFKALLIQNGFL